MTYRAPPALPASGRRATLAEETAVSGAQGGDSQPASGFYKFTGFNPRGGFFWSQLSWEHVLSITEALAEVKILGVSIGHAWENG